jgi:hypothetical protein
MEAVRSSMKKELSNSVVCLILAYCLVSLPFAPEDGDIMFFRNVDELLCDYVVLHSGSLFFKATAFITSNTTIFFLNLNLVFRKMSRV